MVHDLSTQDVIDAPQRIAPLVRRTPLLPSSTLTQHAGAPVYLKLETLQETVKRLESGELSLEESLKAFEEGVKLTRLCQTLLRLAGSDTS